MRWKATVCFSFLKTQVYSTILLSSLESMIDMYCFCLPGTHPPSWSNIPIFPWGTISDSSTWVVIEWDGHVSKPIKASPSSDYSDSLKDVMWFKLVHWDSFLRFLLEISGKRSSSFGTDGKIGHNFMNFPPPITADKNKAVWIWPFVPLILFLELWKPPWHLLGRIYFMETNIREIRLERF